MGQLRIQLYKIWAKYWYHHLLRTMAEFGLAAIMLGGAVVTVATIPTIHHPAKSKPPVIAVSVAPKPVPKPQPKPTPAPAPVPTPPPSPPPSPPATPVAAPQPIPVTQPSPGTGVKQLSSAPPPTTTSSPASTTTTTSTTSSSSTTTSQAPAAATGGYYSTNWSGYAALSGSFTTVAGSWVVPDVTGNGTSQSGDAAWIGIGGVNTTDLIQTGTSNMVDSTGTVSTFAFYELLPDPALEITSLPVHTGDSMSASIKQLASGQWQIAISDTTTGQQYSTTVAYASSNSSAEWIEEDPSYANGSLVPFDNFDHVVFSDGSTTKDGALANLSDSSAAPITLLSSTNQPLATPSVLINSGTGFWVTYN